jgi:hypothetical protein
MRYFLRTELLELAKDQDLFVYCWESRYSAAHRLSHFSPGKRLERRFVGRSESVEIAERLTDWPTLLPAMGLQCFIYGHTSHPRAKGGLRPEGR